MSETATVKVLGISGSLRKNSHNSAALRAAGELMPQGMTLASAEISDFPLYHDDIRLKGYPPPLQRFRAEIAAADAILFATPEFNWSIPGVLKNAIDWASRPPDQPFIGKPYAIIGAASRDSRHGAGAVPSAANLHLRRYDTGGQARSLHHLLRRQIRCRRAPRRSGDPRSASRNS